MHFIEIQLSAPYRYDKIFKGKLKKNNKIYSDSYKLFVRYNGVEAGTGANIFEEKLYKKKNIFKTAFRSRTNYLF